MLFVLLLVILSTCCNLTMLFSRLPFSMSSIRRSQKAKCSNGIKVFYIHSNFFFFGRAAWLAESYFPDQGSNPGPLQWKRGVLNTELPGNREFPIHSISMI